MINFDELNVNDVVELTAPDLFCNTCGHIFVNELVREATYIGLNRIDDSREVYHTFELHVPVIHDCGKEINYYMELSYVE